MRFIAYLCTNDRANFRFLSNILCKMHKRSRSTEFLFFVQSNEIEKITK